MGYIPGLGESKVTNDLQAQQNQLAQIIKQIQMGLPASPQNPAIVGSTVPQQSGAPSWGGDYNTLAQQLSQGQGGQPYTMPMSMVNPWLMGRSV